MRCALLIAVSFVFFGCGAVFEPGQVSRRFESVFSCAEPSVSPEAGGYRVEGCGVVAHYACFPSARDHRRRRADDSIGAIFASALVEAAFSVDDCVMEHSERVAAMPTAGGEVTTSVATRREAQDMVLKVGLGLTHGRLELLGKPQKYPGHALVVMRAHRRLPPSCQAELFVDGVPLRIEQVQRTSDFVARVMVPSDALQGVGSSLRFAGEVCGVEFSLRDEARRTVGEFVARFAEERARFAAAQQVAASR